MKAKEVHENIIASILKLTNQINEFESIRRSFGTDKALYPSEIHTIAAVGCNQDLNITDLSIIMGIRKSSVSEIIKKLEKKEMIIKNRRPGNKKEIHLSLTEQGKTAFQGHKKYHEKMYSEIFKHMEKLPVTVLEEFNESINEINLFLEEEIGREENEVEG